jgi:hypothetical protein
MPLRRHRLGVGLFTFLTPALFAQVAGGNSDDQTGHQPPARSVRSPEVHVCTDAKQRVMAVDDEAIRDALWGRVAEFVVSDVPFDQALRSLLEKSRVRNWHVRWEPLINEGVAREKRISVNVRDTYVWRALDLLLGEVSGTDVRLAYEPVDGVLIVSTDADLYRRMDTRVYPIGDLITGDIARMRQRLAVLEQKAARAPDPLSASAEVHYRAAIERMKAAERNPIEEDEQQNEDDEYGHLPMQWTITLIQQSVEPDTWVTNGGTGTIQAYFDSIVGRNNVTIHRALSRLLNDLRAAEIANAERKKGSDAARP